MSSGSASQPGCFSSKAIRLTRDASAKTLEAYYDKLGLSDAIDAMEQLPGLGGGGGATPSRQPSRIRQMGRSNYWSSVCSSSCIKPPFPSTPCR